MLTQRLLASGTRLWDAENSKVAQYFSDQEGNPGQRPPRVKLAWFATPHVSRLGTRPAREHNFFSEGYYWWPDPKGPYLQRDGMTNAVPALAAAYKITRDRRYAEHAAGRLRA